jgi:diaminopimelate decarboxylase
VGASVLTPVLSLRDGTLACEGVALDKLAEAVGTPAYVYSTAGIREQFSKLDKALTGVPHRIHYSLKANANWAILRLIRSLGGGAEAVSGGRAVSRAAGRVRAGGRRVRRRRQERARAR